MDFQPLPEDSPDLVGYSKPKLMAIGDSIFNGTRSLSTMPGPVQLSAPAIVARGLGIDDFRVPNYPRPVLFDLEQHIRDGFDTDRLLEECLANAKSWLDSYGIWSNTRFFDNIAIAGAEYKSLSLDTSGHFKVEAKKAYENLQTSSRMDFESIYKLYYAINAAFLLNPSGDPDLDDLTPLEQVASRRPKRLLVNIGSNEGLFRIALTANYSRENINRTKKIPALARNLGIVINKHCEDIENIYFNLLVRPRTIANLAPPSDEELFLTPPNSGYFSSYIGRLFSLNGMKAPAMQKFDKLIAEVNEETKKVLQGILGTRVHFVNLYELSENHDRKHGDEKEPLLVQRGESQHRLCNFPFSTIPICGGFRHGGLFGLDNLHPTLPGYALLANQIGAEISAAENVAYKQFDVQSAYEADTLHSIPTV